MTIKFKKPLSVPGHDYPAGQTIENAQEIFGAAQTEYFVEQGFAELVREQTPETATKKTTTEKAVK